MNICKELLTHHFVNRHPSAYPKLAYWYVETRTDPITFDPIYSYEFVEGNATVTIEVFEHREDCLYNCYIKHQTKVTKDIFVQFEPSTFKMVNKYTQFRGLQKTVEELISKAFNKLLGKL